MRYLAITLAVVGLISGIGFVLIRTGSLPGEVNIMCWVAGLSALAAVFGLVPMLLVARSKHPEYLPQAVMGGMTIRLLICAGSLLVVRLFDLLPFMIFTMWLLVFYFALLIVETSVAWLLGRQVFGVPKHGVQA